MNAKVDRVSGYESDKQDSQFHTALAWLTALSVSIATLVTA